MTGALAIIRPDAQLLLAVLLFVLSLVRSDASQKALSGALLLFLSLDFVRVQMMGDPGSTCEVNPYHLLLDVLLFCAIVPVALRGDRLYPLWLGGAQIVVLMAHAVPAALSDETPLAYALMNRLPIYVQLAALAYGQATIVRDRRET